MNTNQFKCPVCDHISPTKAGIATHFSCKHPELSKDVLYGTSPNCPICNERPLQRFKSKFRRTCGNPICIKKLKGDVARKNGLNIDKIKATKLARYGNENYCNTEKIKKTCMEKYGCCSSQDENIKQKITDSRNKNYYENKIMKFPKVIPLFSEKDYKGNTTKYKWKCTECSTDFLHSLILGSQPRCPVCFPVSEKSLEKKLENFLRSFNMFIELRTRTIIPPYELDFYFPDKKIAIELNGLYWHSELNGEKTHGYHQLKYRRCKTQGIQLIQIWDIEWINKQDIIESMIQAKLGFSKERLYARKLTIKEVSYLDASNFLNNTHLQGNCLSSKRIGLYDNDKLVALMTFGRTRYDNKHQWELLRFSVQMNTTVVGGFSRLLSYFRKSHLNESIITYADLRYSNGDVYLKNGFTKLHESAPSYYYTKGYQGNHLEYRESYKKLESRIYYQKHKLSKILKIFDPEKSEWENMKANGYDRVWDCGCGVFEIK